MEDMFEGILGLIIVIVGIVAKNVKGKKKAGKSAPASSAWDELDESVEKKFDALIKKHDGEPIIPYAPSQPAPAQPAQPVVVPPQPAVTPVQPAVTQVQDVPAKSMPDVANVPEIHMEGAPATQTIMPEPAPVLRWMEKEPETNETFHGTPRSRVMQERMTADTLRRAFVMSEVLGKPVSLKNTVRR